MLPRARAATHAARAAPSTASSSAAPAHALRAEAETSHRAVHVPVARARIPPRDWSQPSTSKIPYSPPRRALPSTWPGSRPLSTSARLPDSPTSASPLSTLQIALDAPSPEQRRKQTRSVADSLETLATSLPPPQPLSRAEYDTLFDRVAALLADEPAFAIPVLKRLRDLARRVQPDWALSLPQIRAVLLARIEQEGNETTARRKRGWEKTAGTGRREDGKMRVRQRYLDECAEEYWSAVQDARARGALHGPDVDDAASLMERYARTVASRLPTAAAADALAPEIALPVATLSARAFTRAFSLIPPFPLRDEPVPDHLAALPLVTLFTHSRTPALAYLHTLLTHGRLPSMTVIRRIVSAHYAARDAQLVARTNALSPPRAPRTPTTLSLTPSEADEAAYAHARTVLNEACAGWTSLGSGSAGDRLDLLLEQRLERVERAEALAREPMPCFIRWLGLTLPAEAAAAAATTAAQKASSPSPRSAGIEARAEMVRVAIRLWEASQVQGKNEWDVPARRYARNRIARLLETLLLEAVKLQEELAAVAATSPTTTSRRVSGGSGGSQDDQRPPSASPCLVEAVQAGMAYLQHHILVHHSVPVLRALTVSSHAPALALQLFEHLSRAPASPAASDGRRHPPFTWSAALLPTLTTLFFSASATTPSAEVGDSSLPLRLYLSWTASGLSFPIGLWPALWRATGRRGSLDELRRLVHDWEDTGRGTVSARIMRFVLAGATEFRVVAPLRMLAFFRARYVSRPGTSPSPLLLHAQPYLVVPLEGGYEAVLDALARSHTDRRRAMRAVWRWMTLDGHTTPSTRAYNALLRAQISRPPGQFSLADLDAAGLAYTALVRQARQGGPGPDGDTFALLVRGFARVAAGGVARAGRKITGGGNGEAAADPRTVALEAAKRTFEAARVRWQQHAQRQRDNRVDLRFLVSGVETALLVRLLARAHRFEDAKTVQEQWWAGVVAALGGSDSPATGANSSSRGGGGEAGAADRDRRAAEKALDRGMREMRWARDEAGRIEARAAVAVADAASKGGRRSGTGEGSSAARGHDPQINAPVAEEDLAPPLRPLDPRM